MYFITCFERYGKTKLGWPDIGSSRTFVYYPHKEWAIEDLHSNNLDIHEEVLSCRIALAIMLLDEVEIW